MWRIPRIRRIEYALDFLNGIKEGLDEENLKLKLNERKYLFELHKYKVVGRGHPFSKKLRISGSTLVDCFNLTKKLGFIDLNQNTLTDIGEQIVAMNGDEQISFFVKQFINAYDSVKAFLLIINNDCKKELVLPLLVGNQDFKIFISHANKYGIEFDPLSFSTVRDILSQVGLINWMSFADGTTSCQKIYLTSIIDSFSEKESYFSFTYNNTNYSLFQKTVNDDEFRNILWQEYMRSTEYVPRLPVFYSDLRNSVCDILKISDQVFDKKVKEVMKNKEYFSIKWSSGTLHFNKNNANLFKNIPPLSDDGKYMIYLLISRK